MEAFLAGDHSLEQQTGLGARHGAERFVVPLLAQNFLLPRGLARVAGVKLRPRLKPKETQCGSSLRVRVGLCCRQSWTFAPKNELLYSSQALKFLLALMNEALKVVGFFLEPIGGDFPVEVAGSRVVVEVAGPWVEIREERTDATIVHFAALVAAADAVGPRMALEAAGEAQIQLLLWIVLPRRLFLGGVLRLLRVQFHVAAVVVNGV
jgi:hypothetical protein